MDANDNIKLGLHIKSLANGDTSALDLIYVMTKKIMKSVAMGRLYINEEAEDIVHDAYIHIVTKADKFVENSNAIGWVLKIVDNLVKNKLKRMKHFISVEKAPEIVSTELNAEDNLIIKQVLDSLNDYERFLIYYKYWCCLSLSEISAIIKKPKTTIASQIKKLEEKIRKF